MKKRNKYYLKEKEYLKLKNELYDLYSKQKDLGYVLLDKPIHDGYQARLVLRYDISNRIDAHIFQDMIDSLGTISYAKKEKYLDWNNKNYLITSKCHEKPHFEEITEDTYNNLNQSVKKWFSKTSTYHNTWKGMTYYCNVPSFFFEIVVEKRYINKVKVIDTLLIQEEVEIKKILEKDFYYEYYHENAPKSFRKYLNSGRRTDSKRKMKKIFDNIDVDDNTDIIFDDNYKDANWRYY
jgi:hypothetical protein